MFVMTLFSGLVASMLLISVYASLVAMRHEDVTTRPGEIGYNHRVF